MFALLLAAGAAVATRNLVPFQLTISDQSPLVQFTPATPVGWNSSFTKSDWLSYTEGQGGMGASWHWINTSAWEPVARPGFSVGLSASDIIVMGDVNGSPPADNAIAAVVTEYREEGAGQGPADEGNSTDIPASQGIKLSPGQLARVSNLDVDRPLLVEFTITDAVPSVYNVRTVIVTTALWSDAESFDEVPQSTQPFVVNGRPNPEFEVDGSTWAVNTSTVYDDNTALNVTELYCPKGDQESKVTVNVPPRTAFVLIRGTTGPDRSSATYSWEPAPPGGISGDWQVGNASRPWVSRQTLYGQRLDPDVNYVLDVSQSSLGNVYLEAVTFYSANRDSSKTPVGAIVGGVVGGVGGAVILVLLSFYFCVWRPRKRREREEEAMLGRDNAGFIPFGSSGDDGGQQPFMQETDAGTLTLPPQYNPEWSSEGGSLPATRGSHFTNSEKSHISSLAPASGTNSATSALAPLAPWKEPYINGTYTQYAQQEAAPLSAVSPTADSGAPFTTLPPGAAPAQPPPSTEETSLGLSKTGRF